MLNGFSLHEMIWDDDGNAIDFRFLAVNDAFYDLTGYAGNLVGKTATELFPELNADSTDWLSVYADVVKTGKGVKFEHFSRLFKQWFSISAYKTDENCFAVVSANTTGYIETERALRESEDKYRTYIEEAPYGIFVYDDTGKYIQVNKAAREMLGYSEEEFQKMSIGDLVSYSENVDFTPREGLKKLLETGRVNIIRPMKHKDGHKILINIEAVTVGKNTHLSFHSDITEKIKVEQALKQSEKNFKQAQKISKTGSWTWNLVTNEVVWTDELYSLFGYQTVKSRPENLTLTTFLSRIHPDDRTKTELHIKEGLERRLPFNFEFRTILVGASPKIFSALCDIKIAK